MAMVELWLSPHLYPSHHAVHVVEMRHKLLTLSLPVVEEVPSPPYKYTWASMTVNVAIPTACTPIGDEYTYITSQMCWGKVGVLVVGWHHLWHCGAGRGGRHP